MFSKYTTIILLTATALVSAKSSCNVGNTKCCNTVAKAGSKAANEQAGILGIASLGDVKGLLGFDCTPLTLVGGGSGAKCGSNPVCCNDVKFNGLVNVGCTVINIG